MLAASCAIALAGCTQAGPAPTPTVTALAQAPTTAATVLTAAEPAELAVGASETFFTAAPFVVAAAAGDEDAQLRAASLAASLGVPVLLAGDDVPAGLVADELARLAATTVLAVGDVTGLPTGEALPQESPEEVSAEPGSGEDASGGAPADVTVEVVPAPADAAGVGELLGVELGAGDLVAVGGQVAALAALDLAAPTLLSLEGTEVPEPGPTGGDVEAAGGEGGDAATVGAPVVPVLAATTRVGGVTTLSDGDPVQTAAVGTARAAGADVVILESGDPRSSPGVIEALANARPDAVVGLGPAFGSADDLEWRAATAATGVLLPSGSQLVFDDTMYVALYGTPGSGALGVLGEQGVPETVARAQQQAASFEPFTDETVVPSVEIIATIASAGAGPDGNYSAERPVSELRPLVDAAHDAGLSVVLDLQPGRTDFLTQAKLYEELLLEPNVGLALDPEWRLGPDQVHLRQIGSVGVDEVNGVVDYLADLTRENLLPQKLMILHQFRLSMVEGRDRLDTSRTELAMMIHVDGQGTQPAKQDTWHALRATAPEVHWGWKNFYDEDVPMLTPEQTMRIEPTPELVSYQ